MARPLLSVASAHSRQLLGYYNNGYYNNSCYNRAGCLAGSIIGAVVFALIALGLLICLLVRLKRQRAANAAYYQQNQQGYTGNAAPPTYPGYAGNQQYPPQYPAQQLQPGAYNNQGQGGPPPPPPPNMTDAQRQEWEAEQYAKYGEAGLVQGYPVNDGGAGPSGGVQMTQIPPHKQ